MNAARSDLKRLETKNSSIIEFGKLKLSSVERIFKKFYIYMM